MKLIIQIQSIAVSFIFGIIFSLLYNLLYYLLFTKYKLINIITNMFFSLVMFGIYFILLYHINNGIFHCYFIGVFILSFTLYCKVFVKLRVKWLKRE